MNEDETNVGSFSRELFGSKDISTEILLDTKNKSVSASPESKKKSNDPVLVFGNSLSSNTKAGKSAIFEFGSTLCSVPEKGPSDSYCEFDSDNSSMEVDALNVQNAIKSAVNAMDEGLSDENEHQKDKCTNNGGKNNSKDTLKINKTNDSSGESVTEIKNLLLSATEREENSLDTFNPQQNQNKIHDSSKSVVGVEIDQGLEFISQESQDSVVVIENNKTISSVSHTTVEGKTIDETRLENKQTSIENQDLLISKDGEHLLKSNTDNTDDGSLDNENCSMINIREDNVEDCSEREAIKTKSRDLQNDQNVECKPIENELLDDVRVIEHLEDTTGRTDKMCNENSNNNFGGSKICSEKKDFDIINTKKSIQIIKDPAIGSTISITLEDVEVSVFEEEHADKLPSLQKITENSSLNNNTENKDAKQLKLNDADTGSDEDASQDSMECDESTLKGSDTLIGGNQLNQGECKADSGLETISKITTVTNQCDKNQRKPSTEEGEESNPNKKESIPALKNESDIQDKIAPSEIVQKLQTDSSSGANSPDAMEVDDESNYKDRSSIHKNVENSVITLRENGEEDSSKIAATNSKTVEITAPLSDNDKDSRYKVIDLESEINSALNKNKEFCKQMLSDTEKEICEENNSMFNKESNEAEVICLFDDDDELCSLKKKPAAAIKCVNPNCMSGEGLDKPAMFVLSYFGLKYTKDQLVCEECFKMVSDHQEKLATMLQAGKPLFTANFPMHKDVILLDSDEESISDNESNLSDDTMEVIRDNLDDVISESLAKFGLDHQIRESCHWLDNKIEAMEDEAKELDQRFDQVQKTLDEFRKQIYENFSHPIKEIEELHFTDCEIPPMPILKNKQQNQRYNMELMKILKKKDRDDGGGGQRLSSPGNSRTIATKKVTQKYQMSPQADYASQDVIAVHSETRCDPPPNLPPEGPLRRPRLRVGDLVYTMKVSYFSIWVQSRVIEIIPRNPTENDPSTEAYRVRFENMKKNSVRTVTGTYLAYSKPSPTQLKVGIRVIAIFKEEDDPSSERENYYVGVIAEPPKITNKYRYLVFFDDGYTQYCPHENILVVCNSSKNVWEDIHPEPRNFIRNYLQQYPERPMVKLSQGQIVKVEWNGRWWIVRVLEVDASLVKVHFDADKRTEWIYRGSTRLGPMYHELAAAKERQSGSLLRSRGFGGANSKSDMPYVEYTRGDGDEKKDEEREEQEEEQQPVVPTRSVARKSTAKKPAEPVISNPVYAKPLVNQLPQGKLYERTLKPLCKPRKFHPHQCGRMCVEWTNYSAAASKHYDPLIVPLMFGFARLNMVFRGKNVIIYKAPCGRSVRSQQEMLCYLQATKTALNIDLFDFDFWVNPLNCFEEGKTFGRIEDLSYGKENVPISCVNELDHSMPQYVQYMTARQPAKDVNLNLDPEFLVGCNCTDDCEDRSKCSCWQLTLQGKAYVPDGELDPLFGYQYRRLPERIATGIYECNSRCKCSSTCQNRVAQQPLAFKLQLFKTLKKGWGIRCLHDIPRGSFICIYAGFLLTETEANEGGKTYGDEYLAELDYIESVEGLKEGYESEAKEMSDAEDENIEMMDIEYEQEQGLDSEGSNDASSTKNRQEDIRLRLRRRTVDESDRDSTRKSKQDDESISLSDEELRPDAYYYTVAPFSDKVRKPQTFNASIRENEERESMFLSVRDLYGKDEQVFIMDAKTHGNIGRYLNHSCSPNVFVQNVFVDTHDLRFPWVAFFANQYVPAGSELTWDYNYDVGSVPGKVMLCYCGSPNCRGRLL